MTDQTATGVLVVDQDHAVLQLLATILSEYGFTPFLASSMEQALTLCERHRPLVGLLDADVLQEDGLAAVTRLREIQPTIRLCLVDAGVPGPPTEEWRALGVVHCLSKPFSLRQLAELLNELCGP